MARERALQMAQSDFHNGAIKGDAVIAQARQYEAFLVGKPVLVTAVPTQSKGRTPVS